MKTKNILRIVFAMIFVLGTMAMNAQTEFYIYNANGSVDEYSVAEVDSISIIPPIIIITNLLLNATFESGSLDPWLSVSRAVIQADGDYDGNGTAQTLPNVTDNAFWDSGLGVGLPHDYGQAARFPTNPNGGPSGIYQLVPVEAGKTYSFKADVLNFRQNTNQNVKPAIFRIKDEAGVLLEGGMVETNYEAIGAWENFSGTITIPEEYSGMQVQFQISRGGWYSPDPLPIAGMLVDNCEFFEVEE